MMKSKITAENLNELKSKTKDKFTLFLINKLIKDINSDKRNNFYETLDYERITNLVKKEEMRNKIKKSKKISSEILVYVFEIKCGNKKRNLEIKNNWLVSDLADIIIGLFNHEPMHLYEFKLKNHSFGPECDEWKEMFDYPDNIRIDSAFNSIDFREGDIGEFIYDFGDNIKHKIKLVEIKKIKDKNQKVS